MVTKKNFPVHPGAARRHPAVTRQNLNFSKTVQNLSYDTNLKNIDQM